MNINLCIPSITDNERKAVLEALNSKWLTHGPFNKKFEESFAQFVGVKYAITCNSCTSALFLSLIALDIKGEVIVPSFSFVATANAVVTAGAIPIFVDIDPKTYNIAPEAIEKAITPQTQAIIPVHYAGQCCRMDEIVEIGRKYNLYIIEDSAETIGGTYRGKKAGSFGKIGCFSFFPTKNITSGEGGMITTNDDDLAKKLKALIGHGIDLTTFQRERSELPWFRNAIYPGYNFRMSNLLAALGYAQLLRINELNKKRQTHSHYLIKNLQNIEWLQLPYVDSNCEHVFQMFTVKVKDPAYRDLVVRQLNKKGIKASVHFYPPIHEQAYYRTHYPQYIGKLPNTENVSRSIITLPMYSDLTYDELNYMVQCLKDIRI